MLSRAEGVAMTNVNREIDLIKSLLIRLDWSVWLLVFWLYREFANRNAWRSDRHWNVLEWLADGLAVWWEKPSEWIPRLHHALWCCLQQMCEYDLTFLKISLQIILSCPIYELHWSRWDFETLKFEAYVAIQQTEKLKNNIPSAFLTHNISIGQCI